MDGGGVKVLVKLKTDASGYRLNTDLYIYTKNSTILKYVHNFTH